MSRLRFVAIVRRFFGRLAARAASVSPSFLLFASLRRDPSSGVAVANGGGWVRGRANRGPRLFSRCSMTSENDDGLGSPNDPV